MMVRAGAGQLAIGARRLRTKSLAATIPARQVDANAFEPHARALVARGSPNRRRIAPWLVGAHCLSLDAWVGLNPTLVSVFDVRGRLVQDLIRSLPPRDFHARRHAGHRIPGAFEDGTSASRVQARGDEGDASHW
jgi:hypothetical protein